MSGSRVVAFWVWDRNSIVKTERRGPKPRRPECRSRYREFERERRRRRRVLLPRFDRLLRETVSVSKSGNPEIIVILQFS
jgi:hypothetical protein